MLSAAICCSEDMFLVSMRACIRFSMPARTTNGICDRPFQYKTRIKAITSVIDDENKNVSQSRHITNIYNEVCAAHLQGFTVRMTQREAILKKAEEAIAWWVVGLI